MVGLVSLAYASPPDPIGESGIYNDADLDDVVIQVILLTSVPVPPIALPDRPREVVQSVRMVKPRPAQLIPLVSAVRALPRSVRGEGPCFVTASHRGEAPSVATFHHRQGGLACPGRR